MPVGHAAQLGLGEGDAPIKQADAGQGPGGGQHAAAGGEAGAVGHVVLELSLGVAVLG
ncbi:hypothetical protein D3C73_1523620 [compost metagenome]